MSETQKVILTTEDIIKIVEETLSRTLSKLSQDDKPIKKSKKKKKKAVKKKVTKKKKTVVKEVEESEILQPERKQRKRQKRKGNKKRDENKEGERERPDVACRVEALDISGNRRLKTEAELGIRNSNKKDKEIDRLLSGNNSITSRSESRTIEVACEGCDYYYDVPPSLLMKENGKYYYVCSNCSMKKKR